MLTWNRRQVQQLSSLEIWFFIVGRVLIAFALGILVATRFPRFAGSALWPALVIGFLMFALATRGLLRRGPQGENGAENREA